MTSSTSGGPTIATPGCVERLTPGQTFKYSQVIRTNQQDRTNVATQRVAAGRRAGLDTLPLLAGAVKCFSPGSRASDSPAGDTLATSSAATRLLAGLPIMMSHHATVARFSPHSGGVPLHVGC